MSQQQSLFLTRAEMEERGWDRPFLVTGDAYRIIPALALPSVHHVLESHGYKVQPSSAPQPSWHSTADFTRFGRPRLGFLVTAGNIDSMVCHYTAGKRPRSDDAYTPGGKAGKRPRIGLPS